MANTKRKPNASGDETKARILAATLETLRNEGIVGTSARAIARTGDFNQALIFYHFGSLDDAIMAAVDHASGLRMTRHRDKLEAADSLPALIRVARELHADDTTTENMTVLAQAFAGAAGDKEMGPKLYAALEPWNKTVEATIDRVLPDAAASSSVPTDQIAQAISAMFLGIELLDGLDPTKADATKLFDSLERFAELLELLIATPLLEMFLASAESSSASDDTTT